MPRVYPVSSVLIARDLGVLFRATAPLTQLRQRPPPTCLAKNSLRHNRVASSCFVPSMDRPRLSHKPRRESSRFMEKQCRLQSQAVRVAANGCPHCWQFNLRHNRCAISSLVLSHDTPCSSQKLCNWTLYNSFQHDLLRTHALFTVVHCWSTQLWI